MILNTLKNRKIVSEQFSGKFDYETDLLVAGLGTAGAVCYYTAVKHGIKCLGIEKTSFFGGTGTAACVQDYYYGQLSGELNNINKIADEVGEKCFVAAKRHPTEYSNLSSSKSYAFEMQNQNSKNILFNCTVTGVLVEGDTVCGVRAFYDGKFININAKLVADNTNGFVSKLAGCEMIGGRNSDNNTMRASKTISFLKGDKVSGEWCSLGYIDNLNEYKLSEKYLSFEVKPPLLLEKYSDENRPVFEGTIVGKRETERVKTEHIITFDELINFKTYEKPIFYGFSSFDNVNEELEKESENLVNWILVCYMRHMGLTFQVPFESILPKGKDGIMVIGKALGTTHDAAALVRMKAEMEKCGEAAASAAAIALSDNCKIAEIDYNKLKSMLIKSGCLKAEPFGIYELRKNKNGMRDKIELPKTPEEIKSGLLSEKPQFALFVIFKTKGEGLKEQLYAWLENENKILRNNSAIALGLIKDKKCLPVLREIISDEPEIHNVFNGKHYYGWLESDLWSDFIKAIILLGRFKDKASLQLLKNLKTKEFSGSLKWMRIYNFIDETIKEIK